MCLRNRDGQRVCVNRFGTGCTAPCFIMQNNDACVPQCNGICALSYPHCDTFCTGSRGARCMTSPARQPLRSHHVRRASPL